MNVSVIICTYNRVDSLKRTLQSIKAMSVPDDIKWELLIVDNNSTDNTMEVVDKFTKISGINCRYVFEENQGLSHARNRGIKEAKGEILAYTDDDVIVTRDWLTSLHKAFKIYNPAVVGGKVLLHNNLPIPQWFSRNMSGPVGGFDIGDNIISADDQYEGIIGIGANISFKKEVFDKIGLFRTDLGRKGNDLSMGEEAELYWRIKTHGKKCIYYPFATVYHCIDYMKMKKNYIRRWHFRMGEWNYISDILQQKYARNHICGIPRWMVRKAFEDLLRLVWYTFRGSKKEGFDREVRFIQFLGYCFQRVKETWIVKIISDYKQLT